MSPATDQNRLAAVFTPSVTFCHLPNEVTASQVTFLYHYLSCGHFVKTTEEGQHNCGSNCAHPHVSPVLPKPLFCVLCHKATLWIYLNSPRQADQSLYVSGPVTAALTFVSIQKDFGYTRDEMMAELAPEYKPGNVNPFNKVIREDRDGHFHALACKHEVFTKESKLCGVNCTADCLQRPRGLDTDGVIVCWACLDQGSRITIYGFQDKHLVPRLPDSAQTGPASSPRPTGDAAGPSNDQVGGWFDI
ncbi:hypothetical protein P154DRAFT_536350 [Amniculicola lignicola CBS 123094]|uniref:Uncharacterized protein n=1 Tax=Amniculicola lignicola CBS 123094 TaxID=1392246 RepID=A0A6A5WC24_9PLEO|nr:hypothetical protein P154DRAFT_536350 [Amniculicola lignicola CBS 123094]